MRLVFKPFYVGDLQLRDHKTLPKKKAKEVMGLVLYQLSIEPPDSTCEGRESDGIGKYNNVAFGVYDDKDLIGAFYLGEIYMGLKCRFLPCFPTLDEATADALTLDIIDTMLNTMSFTQFEVKLTADDPRTSDRLEALLTPRAGYSVTTEQDGDFTHVFIRNP